MGSRVNYEPSEADMASALAFVAGDMNADGRLAFERRLAEDPELAAFVQACLDDDEFLWRHREVMRPRASVRARRSWRVPVMAAAATVLVALGLRMFLVSSGGGSGVRVGLLPGFVTGESYSNAHPALAGQHPPWADAMRGGEAEANVTAQEFLAKAAGIETREQDASLEAHTQDLESEFFHVVVELAERRCVVVLAIPSEGASWWMSPSKDALTTPEQQAKSAQLAAGRHVFPERRVFPATNDSTVELVDFSSGSAIPLGAHSVDLVIGVRERALTVPEVAELNALFPPAGGTANAGHEQVNKKLSAMGFDVLMRTVTEPARTPR